MSDWPLGLTRVAPAPVRATLLDRPHRFAVRCRLEDGTPVEAHLPDPGRLTGTLRPGCEVLLDGPYPPGRRSLLWTCLAMRTSRAWVGTVSALANALFPLLLDDGFFPELDGWRERRAEVRHGRSRIDWQLLDRRGRPTWVECKSVTLARGRRALFPDAVTARGARHLEELAGLVRGGERAAVVFLAQRGDVRTFEPARDIDPQFARALDEAAAAGVAVLAASVRITRRGALPGRRLDVSPGLCDSDHNPA